jgi:hypothetical protein
MAFWVQKYGDPLATKIKMNAMQKTRSESSGCDGLPSETAADTVPEILRGGYSETAAFVNPLVFNNILKSSGQVWALAITVRSAMP